MIRKFAIKEIFPIWGIKTFASTPQKRKSRAYWQDAENRKNFMDDFAKTMKIEKLEDWYEVTKVK